MTQSFFVQYFQEPIVISALQDGATRLLYIDDRAIQKEIDDLVTATETINTSRHRFLPNFTSKIQPLDQLDFLSINQSVEQSGNENACSL